MRAKTMLLKACRHCGGDLVLDVDEKEPERAGRGEKEFVCLQCGRRFVLAAEETRQQKEHSRQAA